MKFKPHNELLSSVSHFLGGLFSIAALVFLVILATLYGNVWHIVGVSIFGASLVLLYFASAIYHAIPPAHELKKVFQRIDHGMIYVLIAGTYTPITLLLPERGLAWTLLGVVWGLAISGVAVKLAGLRVRRGFTTLSYLLLGWLVVVAIAPIAQLLSAAALGWLVAGGLLYTAGTLFVALEHLFPHRGPLMHNIFHVLVLAGSASHYWLVANYVLYL